jgi:putative FmdB family regulatory protein
MPLYEYSCHNCGQTFEVIQKFSDAPLTIHEACGGEVERLISPPALQFKGSGWYVTDYARNGTAKSSEGAESKSESKADAKSDSKLAAKTETSTPASTSSKPAAESK